MRPEGEKVPLGGLDEGRRNLNRRFSDVMSNAEKAGEATVIAVLVHPRWDETLSAWDLHIQFVADVAPGKENQFFSRLCRNFSTPHEVERVKSIGAWVNYCANWILDHREIPKWRDEAVRELWSLKSVQFMRKRWQILGVLQKKQGQEFRMGERPDHCRGKTTAPEAS